MSYRHPTQDTHIYFALVCLAKGFPVATVAYLVDVKPDTVAKWLAHFAVKPKRFQLGHQYLWGIRDEELATLLARAKSTGEDYQKAIALGRTISKQLREGTPPPLPTFQLLTEEDVKTFNERYQTLTGNSERD
jgi:hypothetical protein